MRRRSTSARRAAPRRARGGGGAATAAMAAAPDSGRKEVGEDEGLARKLTAGSVWAEDGRRGEIDEGGGASMGTAMATAAVRRRDCTVVHRRRTVFDFD